MSQSEEDDPGRKQRIEDVRTEVEKMLGLGTDVEPEATQRGGGSRSSSSDDK
jgi:hypothetical protein